MAVKDSGYFHNINHAIERCDVDITVRRHTIPIKGPEGVNLEGINAADINTLSTRNIDKFLEDHPEYRGKKGDIEYRMSLVTDPATLTVTDADRADLRYITRHRLDIQNRGGIMNRETAEFILGDISGAFFKEMAKSKEHVFIAIKAVWEFQCSLK